MSLKGIITKEKRNILVMFLVFMVVHNFKFINISKDYTPNEWVYDYTKINIMGLDIVFEKTHLMDYLRIDLDDIEPNKVSSREDLIDVINFINKFPYKDTQSNPRLVTELGGNCQAKSLLLFRVLEHSDLVSKIVYSHEDNHMYNEVIINDINYKIDLVRSIFVEEEK